MKSFKRRQTECNGSATNRFAKRSDLSYAINVERIEKLPEGVYLATSDDVPGLVAHGRTIAETVEIARDVAKKLIVASGGTSHADLDRNAP
jgi:predicted RNase H-like HicB family nuclease